MVRVTHPRIHLIPLGRVATHRVHWRGELQAHLFDGIVVFPPERRCGTRFFESLLNGSGFSGGGADSEDVVRTSGCLVWQLVRVTLYYPEHGIPLDLDTL